MLKLNAAGRDSVSCSAEEVMRQALGLVGLSVQTSSSEKSLNPIYSILNADIASDTVLSVVEYHGLIARYLIS